MLKHSFSDFSYAVNTTSEKKGKKEILVCYIYNGIEVLRKIYIPEAPGMSYIFEARKIIDQEIKDGTLSAYSYKFIRKNRKRMVRDKKPKSATELIGTDVNKAPIIRVGEEEPTSTHSAKAASAPTAAPKNSGSKKWIFITAGIGLAVAIGTGVGGYLIGKGFNDRDKFDVKLLANDCQFVEPIESIKRNEKLDCHIKTSAANKIVTVNKVLMGSRTLSADDYRFDIDTSNLQVKLPAKDDIYVWATAHNEHELVASPEYTVAGGKATVTGVNVEFEHLEDVGTLIVPEYVEDENGNNVPVTEIREGAFKGLSNLTDLSLPFIGLHKNATNGPIEEHMIGSIFGDLEYTGGIPVWQDYMDYTKPVGEQHIMKKWIIPNDLSDVTITSSEDILVDVGAFSECNRINDIAFKGNVKSIGNFAFYNCGALESVTFDEGSVTSIGQYAFGSCATLTAVGAPMESKELTINLSGVKTIDEYAFVDCVGVQQTYISKTTETIEANAFSGVGGIILAEPTSKPDGWDVDWAGPTTAVVYGSDGELHKMLDTANSQYLFILASEEGSAEKVAYITDYVGEQYASEVEVPNTVALDGGATYNVRHLGMGVFYQYTPITKIIIHNENLASIGNYCFASCYNLQTIEFTHRGVEEENETTMPLLTSIGMGAFAGCRNLVVNDYNDDETVYSDRNKFYGNPVFPISVTTLGESAFKGCSSITNVTLPNLITTGDSAFEACSSLQRVKVGADSYSFGKRAFCDSGLTGVYYYQDPNGPIATGKNYTEISDECFKNTNISVTGGVDYTVIPWYVVSIGEGAFEGCKNITKIGLEPFDDSSSNEIIYSQRLKTIGARAFANCYGLVSFDTLKEDGGLNSIGESAFERCLKLESLETNATELKVIPESCFEGCESLESFLTTSKLTSIESRAFFGCTSLAQAFTDDGNGLLPTTLGKLGDFAFSGCSSISALTITHGDDSPTNFDMGTAVFAGWKTITHREQTDIIGFIDWDHYEADDSNFLCIQKGWLEGAYVEAGTNKTAWGWTLSNASSYHSNFLAGDLATERYKCVDGAGNNLYIHIVD